MREHALVSVIIPAYNAAATLGGTLDSVLQQTWRQTEIIVVDDGSTDATPTLLAGYGEQIKFIRQENAGPSAARNRGMEVAQGKYLAFLDADDQWLPDKLARQVELMEANPDVGFCSTGARVQSSDGKRLNEWTCFDDGRDFLHTLFMAPSAVAGGCSAVMLRADVRRQVGVFDDRFKGFEDPDYWMRTAAISRYACIPDILAIIRRTEGSISTNIDRMRANALAALRKNRALLPIASRGAFWRRAYAESLTDYAKWKYRGGQRLSAIADVLHAFSISPLGCGRLAASLLIAMLLRRPF